MIAIILWSVSSSILLAAADLIEYNFPAYGDRVCKSHWVCGNFGPRSLCEDGVCVCVTGYGFILTNGRYLCVEGSTYGKHCSNERPCTSFSKTTCRSGICQCDEDHGFYLGRCDRNVILSKQDVLEPFYTPPKYNLLTILVIVAILVMALLFLINKRSLFFSFPCCMKDTVHVPGEPQIEAGLTERPAVVGILGPAASQASIQAAQYPDKPPSYMEAVLDVQHLPSYQEAAVPPPSPKPS